MELINIQGNLFDQELGIYKIIMSRLECSLKIHRFKKIAQQLRNGSTKNVVRTYHSDVKGSDAEQLSDADNHDDERFGAGNSAKTTNAIRFS